MKKYIKYIVFFLFSLSFFFLFLGLYKNETVEKGVDNCMQNYVNSENFNTNNGYWYKNKNKNIFHIDINNLSNYGILLSEVKSCYFFNKDYIIESIANTTYCFITLHFYKGKN